MRRAAEIEQFLLAETGVHEHPRIQQIETAGQLFIAIPAQRRRDRLAVFVGMLKSHAPEVAPRPPAQVIPGVIRDPGGASPYRQRLLLPARATLPIVAVILANSAAHQ